MDKKSEQPGTGKDSDRKKLTVEDVFADEREIETQLRDKIDTH